MSTKFYDKTGVEVHIGNVLVSDSGIKCTVLNINEVDGFGTCMIVQQVNDPIAFSPLTVENMALQFTKIGENGITKEE